MDVLFSPDDELSRLLAEQSVVIDELWMSNFSVSKWSTGNTNTKNSLVGTTLNDPSSSEVVEMCPAACIDAVDHDMELLDPSLCFSTRIEDAVLIQNDSPCAHPQNDSVRDYAQNYAGTYMEQKKIMCSKSRGAVFARKNRERKKERIARLENEVRASKSKHDALVTENEFLRRNIDRLSREVRNLRNVVKNDCEVSKIIEAVMALPSMKVSTPCVCPLTDVSQMELKGIQSAGHNEGPAAKMVKPDLSGVC